MLDSELPLLLREWPPETWQRKRERERDGRTEGQAKRISSVNKGCMEETKSEGGLDKDGEDSRGVYG